ncbi:TetR/AcrR family transcriptional regulator [Nocardiopsis gilva YIM 90087]|uniref:TetR/AcrR family transcriptional regulator n=2 Tax=Nocardiopsis gilva TaxID=280236 RepID=A0A223S344_9ACTN|nr:TetR/AcrR family transcriptional regulator [Nocardiopsis gilva]ASU82553.1 TetR/AcrR family transcriptional regulator [Nocardiopsis gilva YIM 90087]
MPQPRHTTEPSPTARRTRRLIVDAAIGTLAANPSATLAEIADAGDVSRSTLHRHFIDRGDLLAAIDEECRTRFARADAAARLGEEGVLNSLDRLAQEYLGLGPVLGLVFADNAPVDPDTWDDSEERDQNLVTVIERGQRGHEIDSELSPTWVITTFWVLLFGAWLSLKSGMSRRDVAVQLSRTLRKAMGPADPDAPRRLS